MGIFKNGKELTSVNQHGVAIQAIYQAGIVIWQAVRSCFGSGYWVNNKPWLNNEAWKNN